MSESMKIAITKKGELWRVDDNGDPVAPAYQPAELRRIVACVNACQNVTTEALEHLNPLVICEMLNAAARAAEAMIRAAEERGAAKASDLDEETKELAALSLSLIKEAADNLEARQIVGAHVDDDAWLRDWFERAKGLANG